MTSTPPTIGIKMDEDEVEISQLHERVKSGQGCVSTVINGFASQLGLLSFNPTIQNHLFELTFIAENQAPYNDSFKRLASSLESSSATLKKEKTGNARQYLIYIG